MIWIVRWSGISRGGRRPGSDRIMSVTFLNPLLLFGLAAAILPILIHRITQRKVVVRRFSAVHLLLQSQRMTAKPQRLKHLFLLFLRILAVAVIVFMMARPLLVRPGYATLAEEGATALILDNSLSMGFGEDRGRRFDTAKRATAEALEGFRGRVTLIPTAIGSSGQGFPWMKPEAAQKHIQALPLSFGRGDTASAFKTAYRQLKSLNVPKQVLVVSDMVRSDWQHLDLTTLETIPGADVTFFRIGGPGRDANFRIRSVDLADGDMVAGVSNRLAVSVSNLSDQNATRQVHVRFSGITVHQKTVDLEFGKDQTVFFDIVVDTTGWIDGEVTLTPDRLSADDRFYFSLNVRDTVRVMIVDGTPKTSLKAGESYYLAGALRPGGFEKSPILTRVITEQEWVLQHPESFDVLFLLNVARPDLSRVTAALEAGKPVFLFLGDRIVPDAYNRFSLAPWKIRERIEPGDGSENIAPGSIPDTLKFLKAMNDRLSTAAFHTYFRIEGMSEKLLTLSSGEPLLVVSDAGRSKLFLFASSADLDWNDLPLTAAYLPLFQGLVKQAAGLTGTSLSPGLPVGAPLGHNGRPIQLTGEPGGPGIVQFHHSGGEIRHGVNPPHEESDLIKTTEDELKKKFGEMDVKVLEYKEDGLKALQGGKRSLWPSLLIFLLAVLALEMVLANGLRIPLFKR